MSYFLQKFENESKLKYDIDLDFKRKMNACIKLTIQLVEGRNTHPLTERSVLFLHLRAKRERDGLCLSFYSLDWNNT